MSKFKVQAHPDTGVIFTESTNKPGWFKCLIRDAEEQVIVTNGMITMQSRVAFPALQGKVVASAMFKDLKDGDIFPLEGKIQRILTATPQYNVGEPNEHKAVENPETGEIMDYFQTYVFSGNASIPDIDLRHLSNVETDNKVESLNKVEEDLMPKK